MSDNDPKSEQCPAGDNWEGEIVDTDSLMWEGIKQAARESSWIPEEYYMNDWVSDVERFLREGDMLQTNVHLLSAASDLLEALKLILPMAELGAEKPSHEGFCGPWSDCDCACMYAAYDSEKLMKARAAIRKAEGKQ